jgi:NAD(P)-dependent dehydrogenase (short-subunit alcohol dehydrogenase family)
MDLFKLSEKVAVITGGAGFLGIKHAEAILDAGGNVALLDLSGEHLISTESKLRERYGKERVLAVACDITTRQNIESAFSKIMDYYNRIDVLINNASNNPKVESGQQNWSRFETFSLDFWNQDINVGLTGAFLCTQVFGTHMAKQKDGVIINIASDLGIIAPDQRLYRKEGLPEGEQPVKPVTYSVVKHALLGLTKYSATYWAKDNIRVNAVCPGGVFNNQNEEFLNRVEKLIPLGRMAKEDEYKGIILYLASDASSYMTGSTVIVDGGRTCW